jgi:hypothetical protein
MTSLLFRGSVVLSADNIEELLVPNGLPMSEGINGSIIIPDALPGRVRSIALYLCDSTQAPSFAINPYWAYRSVPNKYYRVNFNKVVTNADLLSTVDYYIDLMDRIIVFYEEAIEDIIQKQVQYGITYFIDSNWENIYRYVFFMLNGVTPGIFETSPISFVDTYTVLKALAEQHKLHYETKYAEYYASGVHSVSSFAPPSNVPQGDSDLIFFTIPRRGVGSQERTFSTKQYKTSLSDNGLILYGTISPRSASFSRLYNAADFSGASPWPYKYSYEDTKHNDSLVYESNTRFISYTVGFDSLTNRPFTLFNTLYLTSFEYYFVAENNVLVGMSKHPIINKNFELEKNQFQELPYEYYPDSVGCVDTSSLEQDTKFSKTKTKQYYADPRTNNNLTPTAVSMRLFYNNNSYQLYTNFGYRSHQFINPNTQRQYVNNRILANGLTELRNQTAWKYGVRYQHRPTWLETRLSLWQPGPEDLEAFSKGSGTPSFPQKFLWEEDEENPISMYIRSRTHIFNDPDDAGFISFEPTSEASDTPYTHWFGGSSEPPSALKIKVIYEDTTPYGVYDIILPINYFWIRLAPTLISTIEYTNTNNVVDPPEDTAPFSYTLAALDYSFFESGSLIQSAAIDAAKGIWYKRTITPEYGILVVDHYLEKWGWDPPYAGFEHELYWRWWPYYIGPPITPSDWVLENSFHLYTTQHHFNEPL